MAKRYYTTELFDDAWFMDLPSKYKLFWIFLLTKCNHSGIWQVNWKLAQFYTGDNLEPAEVQRLMKNRIVPIENNKYWFIPKFIEFQYGYELNESSSVHKGIIENIKKYKLFDFIPKTKIIERVSKGLPNPYQRIKDKDKDKDIDKDKDKDKCETGLVKIEGHPLQVHIKNNCPNISKLKTQLTYAEAERLVVEFPNDGLQAVIEAMENYKLLAQKSISVNLTIRNWIRRNQQNGTNRKNYTRGSVDINKWDRELKIARGEMPDLDAGAIK